MNPTFYFFGSGRFARLVLEGLLERGCRPRAVVSLPDAPAGRGRRLTPTPVSALALDENIELHRPPSPNRDGFPGVVREAGVDFTLTADYGKIIGRELLAVPRRGGLGVHPSLLPRLRGPAPVVRAITEGESETGVSVFLMDEGVDTGRIVLSEPLPIGETETRGELEARLSVPGAELALRAMEGLLSGRLEPREQEGEPSYAPKVSRDEERFNPELDYCAAARLVNGLSPSPCVRAEVSGVYCRLLRAEAVSEERGLCLRANGGWVRLLELLPAGKRAMSGEEFLRGRR